MDWLGRIKTLLSPRPPLDLDASDMYDLAGLACESEEWDRALTWLNRAIELAPGSARLWSDRGFVLEQMGDPDGAYTSYVTAARLGDDGEPLLFAALIRLRRGRTDEAVGLLVRALALSPEIALELEHDPDLELITKNPELRASRRAALERL